MCLNRGVSGERRIPNSNSSSSSNSSNSSSKMADSPMRDGENSVDLRATMKKHLEDRFTKQFLDKESSIDEEPRYSLDQVHTLVDIVERLLFASAGSLEKYSNMSTLEDRFRYIVVRFLRRKMRTRIIEDKHRLQKKPSGASHSHSHKERTTDDLSQELLSSTLQSLSIRSRTMTSTRSKGSACQLPGMEISNHKLLKGKFGPARTRYFGARAFPCCAIMQKQCRNPYDDEDHDN